MLDDREILQIVGQEIQNASGGDETDLNRETALAYYLGQPNGKEQAGRSTVTSTDVADAIEWIKPQIMKAFTQNADVVQFDPVAEGDEDQAALESEVVYSTLMKENAGFIAIHEFIQDCLLQKNGIFKVFYDDDVEETTEHYSGISQAQFMLLAADPELEVIEYTESINVILDDGTEELQPMDAIAGIPTDDTFVDVKFKRSTDKGQVRVLCVPPEEFRVNRQHNSLDLQDARFTCHTILKTKSELIAEGYDRELIESIPDNALDDDRTYRHNMQNESVHPQHVTSDPSQEMVEVSECYMRIDLDEDGIAELMKITAAGGDNPHVLLDIEPVDEIPFFSSSAILMSHKFFGLSIFDRLKEIQDQKTALWRNMLDNLYLQNNGRTEAVDGQVNLDDLLVSRPGGIVRVRAPGMLREIKAAPIGGDAYQMMTYLDEVRAGRAGVSPEGAGQNYQVGQETAHGVERLMTAKEELVGLMVRIIAETGLKPVCMRIRDLLRRHVDAVRDFRFRGQWVQINPAEWRDRNLVTVRVGTGTGDRQKQVAAMQMVLQMQEKILMNPQQSLVDERKVFAALDDAAKFAGLTGARQYFVDPDSPEGQQAVMQKQQAGQQQQGMEQQMQQAMAESQIQLAQAEQMKAQAQLQQVQVKAQAEQVKAENEQVKTQLQAVEAQHKLEIEQLKLRLTDAENRASNAAKDAEIQFKYDQLYEKSANDITQMELDAAAELSKQQAQNRAALNGGVEQ